MKFWDSAWHLESILDGEPSTDSAVEAVRLLVSDLVLQQWVFVHREWQDPAWLGFLVEAGLFEVPPPIEQNAGRVSARAWPAITYLAAVSDSQPDQVASLLSTLESDNWWVIDDALKTAMALPHDLRVRPTLHILKLDDGSIGQWPLSDTYGMALNALCESKAAFEDLEVGAYRILRRSLATGRGYDLQRVLAAATEGSKCSRLDWLANAIESALIGLARSGVLRLRSFESLDTIGSEYFGEDSLGALVRAWLDIVSGGQDSGLNVLRSTRLLVAQNPLLSNMGLRALRLSLEADPADPSSLAALEAITDDDDLIWGYQTRDEAIALFAPSWAALPLVTRVDLVNRMTERARSDERQDRLAARDWLDGLRDQLGPHQTELLGAVEDELGAKPTGPRPALITSWVGPESFIDEEEADGESAEALVGYLAHPPGRSPGAMWGPSAEGYARVFQGQVSKRPLEFVPFLPSIASDIDGVAKHLAVMEGMRQAFRESGPTKDVVRVLGKYLETVVERADRDELDEVGEDATPAREVIGSAADLLESSSRWQDGFSPEVLLAVLVSASKQREPEVLDEDRRESVDDLVSRSLNSVQGKAARASLALTVRCHTFEEQTLPCQQLDDLVLQIARGQPSPSVIATYGLYLPQLVGSVTSLWSDLQDVLLGAGVAPERWAAVWATYIGFHPPYGDLADTLKPFYSTGIHLLLQDESELLSQVHSRTISHLLALAVQTDSQSEDWGELAMEALQLGTEEAAAEALEALARAVRSGESNADPDRLLRLIERRLDELPRHGRLRSSELRAMTEVLFAAELPVIASAGAILDAAHGAGSLNPESVVVWLQVSDSPPSPQGLKLLELAVETRSFEGWLGTDTSLVELVSRYSQVSRERVWSIANSLGEQGHLAFEQLALGVRDN